MAVKSGAKLPSGSWAQEVRQVTKRREVRIDFMGIGFDRNPRYSKMGYRDTKKAGRFPKRGTIRLSSKEESVLRHPQGRRFTTGVQVHQVDSGLHAAQVERCSVHPGWEVAQAREHDAFTNEIENLY